ncbi:hypothetical protein D3C76_1445840 [compost metagenome]
MPLVGGVEVPSGSEPEPPVIGYGRTSRPYSAPAASPAPNGTNLSPTILPNRPKPENGEDGFNTAGSMVDWLARVTSPGMPAGMR